ncbi:hypothetical protein AC579_4807 [Pseudocercospora musae]|uniref:Uncharacterized protein n=1 Tax=Pseudocercospora musae TaxID=113226 RepID=A0A139II61_9PEZI|nr:hypothetical protein AC579_4807 [Pseudocercospora musae]
MAAPVANPFQAPQLAPTVAFDNNPFEHIPLHHRTRTSPVREGEGLGSRLLYSLSNAPPTAAAAAIQRSGSILHGRARSWAAYVPKLNTNTTASPEKQESQPKSRPQSNNIFAHLFNGDSAPVQLGVPTSPTKEKEETEFVMQYQPGNFTERPIGGRVRRDSATPAPTPTPTPTPANAANRKTSWFTRKPTLPAPVPAAVNVEDDMLNLNINARLFPHGPADPLSPHAFNDLLLNATNLLLRMQVAYKEKVDYIASIQPEIDAQKEEVDEARTRSEHLKMQLEDIGRKAEEQRQVNEELLIQLSQEKVKVQEAQEQAKTIRLVRRDTADIGLDTDSDDVRRRRKRTSGGNASDSGFESDADTSSVFSANIDTPVSAQHQHQQQERPRLVVTLDHQSQPQVRYASSRDSRMSQQSTAYSATKHNDSAFNAWTTVERLRNENRDLRTQVEEMQCNLQSCIDLNLSTLSVDSIAIMASTISTAEIVAEFCNDIPTTFRHVGSVYFIYKTFGTLSRSIWPPQTYVWIAPGPDDDIKRLCLEHGYKFLHAASTAVTTVMALDNSPFGRGPFPPKFLEAAVAVGGLMFAWYRALLLWNVMTSLDVWKRSLYAYDRLTMPDSTKERPCHAVKRKADGKDRKSSIHDNAEETQS